MFPKIILMKSTANLLAADVSASDVSCSSGWLKKARLGAFMHFQEDIVQIFADTVKWGNSYAIVTFNPGGVRLVRQTRSEDYTAGELNKPFAHIPELRWVDGSQWRAIAYLGSTSRKRDIRHSTDQRQERVGSDISQGGVLTLDMGPGMDPAVGPIGVFDMEQEKQFRQLRKKKRGCVWKWSSA